MGAYVCDSPPSPTDDKESGKSQWTDPSLDEQSDASAASSATKASGQRSAVSTRTKASPWKRMKDPKTGRIFFYNAGTGESTWDDPRGGDGGGGGGGGGDDDVTDDDDEEDDDDDDDEEDEAATTSASTTNAEKKQADTAKST